MPRVLIILLSLLPALIASGKDVTAIEIVCANDVRTCLRHVSSARSNDVFFRCQKSHHSAAAQVKRCKATSVQHYLYDHAGRLTRAEAKLENTGVDYTQEMEYDLNANVTAMRRYGAINAREGALLDDLTIEYQGNRMEFVTDDAEAYPYEASLDFRARAPIASTPGASVAAPFSLLGLTPDKPIEPHPLNPYNYAADFDYDANGNMTQDRHSAITAITYNVLNLPTQVLYEGLANNRPVSEMVYDASGRKHIVRNGVKKLGAFTGDVTRYVGDYIIVNDTVDRLQTPYGYLRDGEFHSYVFDYQGNVMVVVSGDKVDQTNLYYADGLPMNVSTDATANRFKYSAKELSLFRGLPVYDYTARHTLPQLSNTFRTMDPCAESYYSISPYSYCGGDPINFIDPSGMDLMLNELVEGAISKLSNMINGFMGGCYNFSVDGNGMVSWECIDPSISLNDQQKQFADRMTQVVNDEGVTTLNLDLNSSVFIGDINSATIDVGDLESIGSGEYVSDISTFTHELVEQYNYQVSLPPKQLNGKDMKTKAHEVAMQSETAIMKTVSSVDRQSLGGVMFIDIYPFGSTYMTIENTKTGSTNYIYNNKPIGTVILEHKNGTIINCIRK